jgi:hypothetical protein
MQSATLCTTSSKKKEGSRKTFCALYQTKDFRQSRREIGCEQESIQRYTQGVECSGCVPHHNSSAHHHTDVRAGHEKRIKEQAQIKDLEARLKWVVRSPSFLWFIKKKGCMKETHSSKRMSRSRFAESHKEKWSFRRTNRASHLIVFGQFPILLDTAAIHPKTMPTWRSKKEDSQPETAA